MYKPRTDWGGDGAEVIYALRNSNNLSSKIATELENAGQNVRKYYQRRLPSDPSKDYYYMLRETPNNETIIVEYGFADSKGDDVEQLKNNWEKYAEAVVKALANYVGVPYVPAGDNYYIVKSGDTLWAIARKFNISVDELKKANNLTSNSLSIGQSLIIPKEEVTGTNDITHRVVSGDTLYSIARKYNTTVDNIKRLNNLSNNNLSIGQILVIQKGSTPSSSGGDQYVVKSGDTLYGIAKRYNITVDELKKLNNLSNNTLTIGQVLNIPSSNDYLTYTVKSGDNLYNIARTYNTTVSELTSLNNLSTSLLQIGQQLLIPNKKI